MADKVDLKRWVLEAASSSSGGLTVTEVARHIWANHEADLRASGDLFYTWQYDMRWAAQELRHEERLASMKGGRGTWALPS